MAGADHVPATGEPGPRRRPEKPQPWWVPAAMLAGVVLTAMGVMLAVVFSVLSGQPGGGGG